MRWLKVFGLVAVGGLLLACEPPPTATEVADVGTVAFGRGNDNGARIWLPDPGCGVIDGTGAFFWVDCRMQVTNPGTHGNSNLVAQATGVPNPTGKVVHWGPDNPGWEFEAVFAAFFGVEEPPYPCAVFNNDGDFVFTLNWHATVTPSGNATFACHYSKNSAYELP